MFKIEMELIRYSGSVSGKNGGAKITIVNRSEKELIQSDPVMNLS